MGREPDARRVDLEGAEGEGPDDGTSPSSSSAVSNRTTWTSWSSRTPRLVRTAVGAVPGRDELGELRDRVLTALQAVVDPEVGETITDLGYVEDVELTPVAVLGGDDAEVVLSRPLVDVVVRLRRPVAASARASLRARRLVGDAIAAVAALPGTRTVVVEPVDDEPPSQAS